MPLTAIPPSWFLPTLTASSPVGLRACCVPLPTMGFTGFPGSPALASCASLSPPMPHPPELSPPLQPLPCHQGTLPSRRSQVAACATSRPSSTMASVVSAAVANMRHPLLSWASRGFNTLRRPSFEHPKAPSPLISFLLKEVQGRSLGSAHRRRTFVRRRLAEACRLRPQPPVPPKTMLAPPPPLDASPTPMVAHGATYAARMHDWTSPPRRRCLWACASLPRPTVWSSTLPSQPLLPAADAACARAPA